MKFLTMLTFLIISVSSYAQQAATQPPPPSIYQFVDQMPRCPYDINTYMAEHLKYPKNAKKKGTQGRVITRFVVNEDGSISDVKIARGIGDGCDEAATELIKNMPAWKAGKLDGKAVKVMLDQPVQFRLE